jgi:transcriptional regulator with XRE-family HTH domain
MDMRAEVREFLTTRRAKVAPELVGLAGGGSRRVPGLRRGEVAELAGISVEYYAKLERGQIAGASDSVLDGVADALLLDAAERTHLKDLAGAARGSTAPAGSRQQESAPEVAGTVRPGLRRFVDSVSDAVVFVRDDLQNIVAINDLGRQFYSCSMSTRHCPPTRRDTHEPTTCRTWHVSSSSTLDRACSTRSGR